MEKFDFQIFEFDENVIPPFQVLAEVPPALCLSLIPFFGCNSFAVIGLICLCCCFNGCSFVAYNVNHADLAPSFTGLLFGITNTVSNFRRSQY